MKVYLEIGEKRVFAGAIEWAGWCRSGRDEEAALAALLACGARYAMVVKGAVRPAFVVPKRSSDLRVTERLTGNATTDFGAPSIPPVADAGPITPADLRRLRALMQASWAALDHAAGNASDVALTKGPRGGGRDLGAVLDHVLDAEVSYFRRIGVRLPAGGKAGAGPGAGSRPALRAIFLDGLTHAVTQGVPEAGPRGGAMWSPRYVVRRTAWHVIDHAWEIEDRTP